jgi:hypothetical protein
MKGDNTVYKATEKASRVSKRSGKWANLPEIKHKAPATFKVPVRPVLTSLVRKDYIEKKKNVALWRPRRGAGGGAGSSASSSSRTSDRKTGGRTSDRKTGGRTSARKTSMRSSRKTIARMVAGGAVGGAVRSSVMKTLF